MLKVIVHTPEVKHYVGKTNEGKDFETFKQLAYTDLNGSVPFPKEFTINHRRVDGVAPTGYEPGTYMIDPTSFWIDRYGSIRCNTKLNPVNK